MKQGKRFLGIILILAGIGTFLFCQAHSPNMSFGDMLTHLDGWMLKPGIYYGLLIVAAFLVLYGASHFLNSIKNQKD